MGWTQCAKLIKGRSGKQCRERWVNALDPQVQRGNWNAEEQNEIFKLMIAYNTSWSTICKNLQGRTENSIKNYFYSTVRRIQASPVYDYFQQKSIKGNPPVINDK